ncbi:hypothetical protein PSm6_35150 [Pseudomonas solani]|uniref:Uncharacterized protein n=1 Tax=Pseudomonas solani TaxID=2731552 RepID=A0ABM7LC48_9PSED|nr:hypothetical protein [Pseudomonas solani]BCD87108.1 hypothetical protein PSm6_35150 [Pseudomonas solani]
MPVRPFGGQGNHLLHALWHDAQHQLAGTVVALALLDGQQVAGAEAAVTTGFAGSGQARGDVLGGEVDGDLVLVGEEGTGLGGFAPEGGCTAAPFTF